MLCKLYKPKYFRENPCVVDSPSFRKINGLNLIEEQEILSEIKDCSLYSCRYIEHPIEVKGIVADDSEENKNFPIKCNDNTGRLVRVRIAGKPEKNTHCGVYLGESAVSTNIKYDKDKNLKIGFVYNPIIFLPNLKKIVFGYESWWSFIESEDNIEDITDETINNIWYVKAIKEELGA